MTLTQSILIGLLNRFYIGSLDPFATSLDAQRLLYFMQEAGEPLQLIYEKTPQGIRTDDLDSFLAEINPFMYDPVEDPLRPPDCLYPKPQAIRVAETMLHRVFPDTYARYIRVCDLITGYESTFGLDLLTEVHWHLREFPIAKDKITKRKTVDAVIPVCANRFSIRQITLATSTLMSWILQGEHS